jgi:hypothetical protein
MKAIFLLTTLTQVLTLLRKYNVERKGSSSKNLQYHHHHISSPVVNTVITVIGYLHIACISYTRVRLTDLEKDTGTTRRYVPLQTPVNDDTVAKST